MRPGLRGSSGGGDNEDMDGSGCGLSDSADGSTIDKNRSSNTLLTCCLDSHVITHLAIL